jgi:hypothetical protein
LKYGSGASGRRDALRADPGEDPAAKATVVVFYLGPPACVSLAAQVYREHGYQVSHQRPSESRGIPNMGDQVIVELTVRGAIGGLNLTTRAANARLREHRARVRASKVPPASN